MAIQKASGASTNYLSTPSSAFNNPQGDFCLMFWLNVSTVTTTSGTYRSVMGTYNTTTGWEINLHGNGTSARVQLEVTGVAASYNSQEANAAVVANEWHHYAINYQFGAAAGSRMSFYVDGTPVSAVADATANTNIVNAAAPLRIGQDADSATSFAGSLAYLRMFGGLLSQGEILAEMRSTTVTNRRVSTTFDYPLEQSGGTNVYAVDRGPNRLHASSVTGTVTWNAGPRLPKRETVQLLQQDPYLFAQAPSGGTTDTATVGSSAWSGLAALSAASVVALAAVGSLAWSGVRASSTADVNSPTTVGSLAWSGVRATSAVGVTDTARVGSLGMSGVGATSTTGVVSPALVGSLSWSGVRASSLASVVSPATVGGFAWSGEAAQSGTGTTDTARAGALAWSGIRGVSAADVIDTGRVGGISWTAVRATSAADVTSPTRVSGLSWSGVRASSAVGIIDTTRVGSVGWSGVGGWSVATHLEVARVGQLSWAGVGATSVAGALIDPAAPTPADRTLFVPAQDRTLTVGPELRTTFVPAEDRTAYTSPDPRTVPTPADSRILYV